MATEHRVAVVQRVLGGGASETLVVPEECLTAAEEELLRRITGMWPSEGEVTDEDRAALAQLERKCSPTDLASLFDDPGRRHVVTVWCQLVDC